MRLVSILTTVSALLISLSAICTVHAGTVYKITNADGKVRYSEQEPPAGTTYEKMELPDPVTDPAQQEAAAREAAALKARADALQQAREAREKQLAAEAAAREEARLAAMRAEREALELEKARAELEAAKQPQVIIQQIPIRDDRYHHPHKPHRPAHNSGTPPKRDRQPESRTVPDRKTPRQEPANEEETIQPWANAHPGD